MPALSPGDQGAGSVVLLLRSELGDLSRPRFPSPHLWYLRALNGRAVAQGLLLRLWRGPGRHSGRGWAAPEPASAAAPPGRAAQGLRGRCEACFEELPVALAGGVLSSGSLSPKGLD